MMKKIIATISILLVCFTMLIGCSKDPVQEDLINYINNQLPTIVELESKVTKEYEASTGNNFVDDDTIAKRLKDVIIPASDELLAKSKAIVPATEEVKKVHNKYIASITEQNEALNMLLLAASKHDEAMVKTVNEKLANSDKISNEYVSEVEALKKEHNVVSEKK